MYICISPNIVVYVVLCNSYSNFHIEKYLDYLRPFYTNTYVFAWLLLMVECISLNFHLIIKIIQG